MKNINSEFSKVCHAPYQSLILDASVESCTDVQTDISL